VTHRLGRGPTRVVAHIFLVMSISPIWSCEAEVDTAEIPIADRVQIGNAQRMRLRGRLIARDGDRDA